MKSKTAKNCFAELSHLGSATNKKFLSEGHRFQIDIKITSNSKIL